MYQPQRDTAYIRQRLLELQRNYPIVDGLMLVSTGGLVVASTFNKEDSVSRLAAVTRTMYLLAEDTCREFDRGEMRSVHLSFRRGHAGDDNTPSRVVMREVTAGAVLVMVLHIPTAMKQQSSLFELDVERMVGYLAHQITYDGTTS